MSEEEKSKLATEMIAYLEDEIEKKLECRKNESFPMNRCMISSDVKAIGCSIINKLIYELNIL
jgi:hypothetical protein